MQKNAHIVSHHCYFLQKTVQNNTKKKKFFKKKTHTRTLNFWLEQTDEIVRIFRKFLNRVVPQTTRTSAARTTVAVRLLQRESGCVAHRSSRYAFFWTWTWIWIWQYSEGRHRWIIIDWYPTRSIYIYIYVHKLSGSRVGPAQLFHRWVVVSNLLWKSVLTFDWNSCLGLMGLCVSDFVHHPSIVRCVWPSLKNQQALRIEPDYQRPKDVWLLSHDRPSSRCSIMHEKIKYTREIITDLWMYNMYVGINAVITHWRSVIACIIKTKTVKVGMWENLQCLSKGKTN